MDVADFGNGLATELSDSLGREQERVAEAVIRSGWTTSTSLTRLEEITRCIRHDIGGREVLAGIELDPIALAMRHTRQRASSRPR